MKSRLVMPVWAIDHETINITEAAIDSIKNSDWDGEIIIVDNGSTVGGGKLRELADIYIRNKTNLGYARAVNQGMMLGYQVVAIANNDIRVSHNWWTVAQDILKDTKVATVHYRMIPYDEPIKLGDKTFDTGRERWCTGSFFVARNIQLFDEDFLNSYDDWDYQYRFRMGGFKTVYTTRACYQHLDSYTQQKVSNRDENNQRNRELFKQKHGWYPEDIWYEMYPEQMQMDWKSGFSEL